MTEFIYDPPNERPIKELYAFLSFDSDGNEGICATMLMPLGSTPMVTAKETVVGLFERRAAQMAAKTGKIVRLVKFSKPVVLKTFDAKGASHVNQ